jgi:hypothetical protein
MQSKSGDEQHMAGLEAELKVLQDEEIRVFAKALGLGGYITTDYLKFFPKEDSKTINLLNRQISYLGPDSFLRAGMITSLEHIFNKTEKDALSAKKIAKYYLSLDEMTSPERLACYYIMNVYGDKEEKIASAENLFKAISPASGEWDNIILALILLGRCEIPDEIKEKVSTVTAGLIVNSNGLYLRFCPAILEKTGLSEDALNFLVSRDKIFINDIMAPAPLSYKSIPMIKMLAKFSSAHKELFEKIKKDLSNHRYNSISYAVFLGNMEKTEKVEEEFRLMLGNTKNSLIQEAIGAYTAPSIETNAVDYRQSWLDYFVESFNKDPQDELRSSFYIFMCGEMGDRIQKNTAGFTHLISLFENIFLDEQGLKYHESVFPIAAQIINSLSLKTPMHSELPIILRIMLKSNNVSVVEMAGEAARKAGLSIVTNKILLSSVYEPSTRVTVADLNLMPYKDIVRESILAKIEKIESSDELKVILEAQKAIKTQLAQGSFGIKKDDYADTTIGTSQLKQALPVGVLAEVNHFKEARTAN